jgi:hypothetical protein
VSEGNDVVEVGSGEGVGDVLSAPSSVLHWVSLMLVPGTSTELPWGHLNQIFKISKCYCTDYLMIFMRYKPYFCTITTLSFSSHS